MDEKQYTAFLERKQAIKSDRLEEIHLEAAIDAQFLFDNSNKSGSESPALESAKSDQTIDRVNPNAVPNCLSPYVPTKAASIAAFLSFVQLRGCNDVLLDIGCGDGRVCAVAAKLVGCRAIGLDVSPACIESANKLAKEEGVASLCQFFQLDATTDPKQLFAGESVRIP
jgi:2-polyprenyl-3-methyl-5-hydroxy-6-metoxy-1,4-benzoquinol methylase